MLIRTPAASASASALAVPATGAAAPWRALFLQHLGQMAAPLCSVSTLHPGAAAGEGGADSGSRPTATTTPRVRTCVCRGLWASLPANARNPAPRNPPVYESDLPVFTTDARMAKAWELQQSAACGGGGSGGGGGTNTTTTADNDGSATGGGGPVEAVWWAAEAGTQWRVRGTAWVLGPDVEGAAGEAARAALARRMRGRSGGGGDDEGHAGDGWSWSREVTAHFGNLSPAMRGSFRNPAPGTVRRPEDRRGLGAPVDDEHLDEPAARANFRVCVIVPETVDQVDLSRADDPRRWLYTYVGEEEDNDDDDAGADARTAGEVINGWRKVEVWP